MAHVWLREFGVMEEKTAWEMVEDSDIYSCAPEREKGCEELHLCWGERSLTFLGIVAAFHELTNCLYPFSHEMSRLLYVLCKGNLQWHSCCCVSQKLLICVWVEPVHVCTRVRGCLQVSGGQSWHCPLLSALEVGFLSRPGACFISWASGQQALVSLLSLLSAVEVCMRPHPA